MGSTLKQVCAKSYSAILRTLFVLVGKNRLGFVGTTNGERILMVDDIPEQREIATAILKKLGYHVASTASGEEAISYLREHSADLLILDMIMEPVWTDLKTTGDFSSSAPCGRPSSSAAIRKQTGSERRYA